MTDEDGSPDGGLVDMMAEINAVEDPDRRAVALMAWVRSEAWHPVLMLCEDWQGRVAREAFALLTKNLDADTPGRRWATADVRRGRKKIMAALKIDPEHPSAFYATFPFRIVEADGATWIGGAVGCPQILTRRWWAKWEHIDIEEVLLWNPKTDQVGILGEAPGQSCAFIADRLAFVEERLTLYADGFSFFRAWADRRSITRARILGAKKTHVRPTEPSDSDVPGALLVGDIVRAVHRLLSIPLLVAGPGIDAKVLKRAIFRAANLPTVEAA